MHSKEHELSHSLIFPPLNRDLFPSPWFSDPFPSPYIKSSSVNPLPQWVSGTARKSRTDYIPSLNQANDLSRLPLCFFCRTPLIQQQRWEKLWKNVCYWWTSQRTGHSSSEKHKYWTYIYINVACSSSFLKTASWQPMLKCNSPTSSRTQYIIISSRTQHITTQHTRRTNVG